MQENVLPRFFEGSPGLNMLEFPKMFMFGCAAVPPPVQAMVVPFTCGCMLPTFGHVTFAGNSVRALKAAMSGPAAPDAGYVRGPSTGGLAAPRRLTHR